MINRFIVVRTEFEGFHYYPGAGSIDSRIAFLELNHRHMFKVEARIQVFHDDRELEFFLVKWDLQEFIGDDGRMNHKSCEMMALDILTHLQSKYGRNRMMTVTVSEDGESDGVIEYVPE